MPKIMIVDLTVEQFSGLLTNLFRGESLEPALAKKPKKPVRQVDEKKIDLLSLEEIAALTRRPDERPAVGKGHPHKLNVKGLQRVWELHKLGWTNRQVSDHLRGIVQPEAVRRLVRKVARAKKTTSPPVTPETAK